VHLAAEPNAVGVGGEYTLRQQKATTLESQVPPIPSLC